MRRLSAAVITLACLYGLSATPAEARHHRHHAVSYKAHHGHQAARREARHRRAHRQRAGRASAQAAPAESCAAWEKDRLPSCNEPVANLHPPGIRQAPPARPVWLPMGGRIVTVDTAAGIRITVAASLAPAFQGFIADLVATGYRPRQIHCYARGGHVHNSNHYRGAACDVDQRGWNRTARPMYRIGALAAKWGLRDGCTFRDCGHVDVPRYAGR